MSQTAKLLALLSDGLPHSTLEVMEKIYGSDHLGLARVGARIWDLKQKGHQIIGWKDKKNPAIYWYQMVVKLESEEVSSQEKNWPKKEASLPQENSLRESSRDRVASFQPMDTQPRQEMLHLW